MRLSAPVVRGVDGVRVQCLRIGVRAVVTRQMIEDAPDIAASRLIGDYFKSQPDRWQFDVASDLWKSKFATDPNDDLILFIPNPEPKP